MVSVSNSFSSSSVANLGICANEPLQRPSTELRKPLLPALPASSSELITTQTPLHLLEATEGKYDSLPRFERKAVRIKKVAKKILLAIRDITLLIPIITAIGGVFFVRPIMKYHTREAMKRLSSLGTQRFQEKEKIIQEIARKAGIPKSDQLKLFLMRDIQSPAAAVGNLEMLVSPEYLVKPEDLPSELKLERLDKNEISEEVWVVKFNKWLDTSFLLQKRKPYKSRYAVDKDIAYKIAWLRQFRFQARYEKNFEGLVAHELGHCYYGHSKKLAITNICLSLLSIPTLGLASIFKKRLMTPLKNAHEKQADLFSAEKFGPEGLINVFSAFQETGKTLHAKYPERFDATGNNLKDRYHPAFSERIAYLQKLSAEEN